MKFIMVLVMMLSATVGGFVNADNITQFLPREHSKVADYISQNFDLFTEKYSEAAKDNTSEVTDTEGNTIDEEIIQPESPDQFNATSIEYRTEVTLTKGGTATYLDFNEDNGYLLIEDDYVMSKFETTGDLAWARGGMQIFFDATDGFMVNVDGELYPAITYYGMLDAEANGEVVPEDIPTGYSGQVGRGTTKIIGPSSYFNDRYGAHDNDYKLNGRHMLSNFNGFFKQDQFIIYRGLLASEGNCVPTAMYNILHYYKYTRNYSRLDGSYTNFVPYFDRMYMPAIQYGYYPSGAWTITLPKMYVDIRQAALENGYSINGLPVNNTSGFLNSVNGKIPYNMTTKSPIVPSLGFINSAVSNNTPLLMIYGDYLNYKSLHAVAVYGVASYKRIKKVWLFNITETRNAVMMSEGQEFVTNTQKVVYMDWEGYMNSCGNPTMKLYSVALS